METMNELLQLSPPIALALLLNLVGIALKKSPIANWLIPPALILLGASVFPFISDYSKLSFECRNPMMLNAIYGGTIGGLAVGLHSTISGFLTSKNSLGGTKFLEKKNAPQTPVP